MRRTFIISVALIIGLLAACSTGPKSLPSASPATPASRSAAIAPSTPQPGSLAWIMSHPWHPDSLNVNATDAQFRRDKGRCYAQAFAGSSDDVFNEQWVFINCLEGSGWQPEGAHPSARAARSAEGVPQWLVSGMAECITKSDAQQNDKSIHFHLIDLSVNLQRYSDCVVPLKRRFLSAESNQAPRIAFFRAADNSSKAFITEVVELVNRLSSMEIHSADQIDANQVTFHRAFNRLASRYERAISAAVDDYNAQL